MTCLSPVNSSVWLCLMDHKNDFIVELDYGCLCLVLWAINATEMLKTTGPRPRWCEEQVLGQERLYCGLSEYPQCRVSALVPGILGMKVKNATFDLSHVFFLIGWVFFKCSPRALMPTCRAQDSFTSSNSFVFGFFSSSQTYTSFIWPNPPSSYEKFHWSFRKLHEDFINIAFSAKPHY